MQNIPVKQLVAELFAKEKWAAFLERFVEVLRINVFLTDYDGKILIPPSPQMGGGGSYGAGFLTTSFGFDLSEEGQPLLKAFEQQGSYLESRDPFDFHLFAVPIKIEGDVVIAHLIVGPIILNKAWETENYLNLAKQLNLKPELTDSIREIRVVSFITIKAILDLLSEVVKDVVQLSYEKMKLNQMRFHKELIPQDIADAAQDLYATIHLDELLVTALDVALNVTNAECGSIMILDQGKGELIIKACRGLDKKNIRQGGRLKLGEGIAGIAAKEKESFFIKGTAGDNRIQHLLKRSEIKQSMVIPLFAEDRVLGVLNLHTKTDASGTIDANVNQIKQLTKLIATAINSL